MIPRIAPDNITTLAPNEVFVFGSNFAGNHGKGAALLAVKKFGARRGQGTGLMGQSYGIATKDKNLKILSLQQIDIQIGRFLRVAALHPEQRFLVTRIGCGLAHYSPKEIAPLFFSYPIPDNVYLPSPFWVFMPKPI